MSRLRLDINRSSGGRATINPSTFLGTTGKGSVHEVPISPDNLNGRLPHVACARKPATTGRCRTAFPAHNLQGHSHPSGTVDTRAADVCIMGEGIESGRLRRNGKRRKVRKAEQKMLWRGRSNEKWRRPGRIGAD